MNRESQNLPAVSNVFQALRSTAANIKNYILEHPHLLLLYWPVFFVLFELSESGAFITRYHTVQVIWDEYIPFCSVFVVPYMAWFFFVGGMTVYTFFCEKKIFVRYMAFVALTYTAGLVAFFLFPSVQHLRPTVFINPGFFDRLVIGIYASDTNTGVFPSLHVVGQLAVLFAAFQCKRFQHVAWRIFFVLSSMLVCASTVFLKQHSLLDVFAGILLSVAAYPLVYRQGTPKGDGRT